MSKIEFYNYLLVPACVGCFASDYHSDGLPVCVTFRLINFHYMQGWFVLAGHERCLPQQDVNMFYQSAVANITLTLNMSS